MNRLQRRLVRYAPFLIDAAFTGLSWSVKRSFRSAGPEALSSKALAALPRVDRNALASPARAARYGRALHEAFRHGGRGAAWDARLLSRPWGFALGDIRHENIHVWHGGLDRNVSIDTGRAVAAAIPGATAHFDADEGHISVAIRHAAEILAAAKG